MLHQSIELVKRWAAIALVALSYQSEFLDDGDGVIEFLPRQWIPPRGPRDRENIRKVREVVAARLRLDGLGQLTRERHQSLTGNVAAFGIAKTAILDALEDLCLRSGHRALGFRDIAVDHR